MKFTFRQIALAVSVMSATATAAMGAPAASRLIFNSQALFAMQVVAAHNWFRSTEAVEPTFWDPQLAAAADAYAVELARTGIFAHSPIAKRQGQGENLWMGSKGAFSPGSMVADWGSEKSMFHVGRFPNVSTTGRWEDVGHYTQIIWPTSIRVGCAMRSSAQKDYFVCRYGQPGNVFGRTVGVVEVAIR